MTLWDGSHSPATSIDLPPTTMRRLSPSRAQGDRPKSVSITLGLGIELIPGAHSQQAGARVLLEDFRVTDVAAQGLDRTVA